MLLPPAPAAASAAGGFQTSWIIGARSGATTRDLARRYGASALGAIGAYSVRAGAARAFAHDLRGRDLLTYAEPNRRIVRASAYDAAPLDWARSTVVAPELSPPPAGGVTIAVVDDFVDPTHPDVGPQTRYLNGGPGAVLGPHGTEVASVAAGAADGAGVFGIFPSAGLLSFGLGPEILCSDVANGVETAAASDARVINLSLGSPDDCFTLFIAVQRAYASGSLVVAAAGNEFAQGNPLIFPAAYPHVLSVAALDRAFRSSFFSSENLAVDVAAPGVDIPVAIPLAFDIDDGVVDGMTQVSGTSYASPMVAGAAAWLAAARPDLSHGQIADVLRRSARDVGPAGYDSGTGFGLIRMASALVHPTPKQDVLEPNDGITFVDGTAFGHPDPFVWRGTGRLQISANADQVEDPIDVYRIRIPRKAAFAIRLHPNFGDPDLTVFSGRAETVNDDDAIIARSLRARGIDVVHLVNDTEITRSAFVMVELAGRSLSVSYRLEFVRTRR